MLVPPFGYAAERRHTAIGIEEVVFGTRAAWDWHIGGMSVSEEDQANLRQSALRFHEFPKPGKIELTPTKPLSNTRDLSLAYSPGVAAPCEEIAADPEQAYRYTAKGNPVLTLSLATNHDIKTAEGERKSETYWHKATVWGKRAETCAKYLVKGSRVYVEGELQMKSWTDKDGITRKSAEIFVDDLRFMDGTRREGAGAPRELQEAPSLAQ